MVSFIATFGERKSLGRFHLDNETKILQHLSFADVERSDRRQDQSWTGNEGGLRKPLDQLNLL